MELLQREADAQRKALVSQSSILADSFVCVQTEVKCLGTPGQAQLGPDVLSSAGSGGTDRKHVAMDSGIRDRPRLGLQVCERAPT